MRTAAVCLLATMLWGCGHASSDSPTQRVIVLGIDAMDPGFVERHWDALPNLDRLRRQGEFKRLATTVPPQSPVAWSTFITGMNPGGHGIYDFVHRDPATLAPFSSMAEIEPPQRTLRVGPYLLPLARGRVKQFRRGRAFWQLLDEHDVPVTMLRVPNNFPPVASKGRTLAGMGTPDLRGTFGTFAFYTDDPGESARVVPGGRIVPVALRDNAAALEIEGPENTLRADRRRTSVTLTVERDPAAAAARFEIGDTQFILRQGEWSQWIHAAFPLIPGLKSAAGIVRVYAKELQPGLRIYVSPVNLDPAEPELPLSTPASYSRELADALGPFDTQGMAEDTAALRAGVFTRAEYRVQSRMVADEQFRLLHYALDHFDGGLLFFHFLGIDQDSHMLWGAHEDELLSTYRRVDGEVGRVLRAARGATVIVMSDHGFARFDRAVHLNTWLWREGFLALDNPFNASDEEGFPHVDWSRTQAYAFGLNAIYLNLSGREKHGIVEPGEANKMARTIADRLRGLRDPATGQPAIAAVYLPRETYGREPVEPAPDLVVGYAAGYRASWQTALGAVPPDILEDNREEWRGDHCIAAELVPGVFISNRRVRLADPRLEDVTVTLLHEFGVKPGEGMQGRAMF